MDDFEELKTSVEKVTANVVDTARELVWEVKPENVTELMQSHEKNFLQMSYFLWMSEETGSLKWNLLLVKKL